MEALAARIASGETSLVDLSFDAESLGQCPDSDLVRRTLTPLLSHVSAIVREGAIYGILKHQDDAVRAMLAAIAAHDVSIAVRQAAMDAIEEKELDVAP